MITLAAGLALMLGLQVNVVGHFHTARTHSNLPENALVTADNAGSKIAASILALLPILTAVVPWKAEVFIVDKTTAAVTLRRNGRQIESELLAIPTLLP